MADGAAYRREAAGHRVTVLLWPAPLSGGSSAPWLWVTCMSSGLLRGGGKVYTSCLPHSLAYPASTQNLALWLMVADQYEKAKQSPLSRHREGPL